MAGDTGALLDAGCVRMPGLVLPGDARQRLLDYLDLLTRWNRSYNLTAITDPAAMVTRHLLDSLSVLPFAGSGHILDAGTGPGLPGVPLAVARPDLQVTLIDSAGKKIRFLGHVKRSIRLENAEPVHARLEEYRPAVPVDTVISRAFASIAEFAAASRALLSPGGRLLAMKGRVSKDELQAVPGWLRVDAIEPLEVPGLQAERHLVIMSVHP